MTKRKQDDTDDGFEEIARDLIKGEFPLVEAFWIYFFLPAVAGEVLATAAGNVGGLIGLLAILIHLAVLLWTGFMVIPIWKSCENYEGRRAFTWLAKIFVVLFGIKVALAFPVF